jgi:hypothetical protein
MLQERSITYESFIDKTNIIFGESGTGKSTLIGDVVYQLKPQIEQVVVICPTDPMNKTYSGGMVPLPFIHYEISTQLLKTIWDRQEALVNVYNRANNAGVIDQLFARTRREYTAIIEDAQARKAKFAEEARRMAPEKAAEEIKKLEEDYKTFAAKFKKYCIGKHSGDFTELSDDEKFTLKYLTLNPRMLLIFDDCTDQIKKYCKDPTVQAIFYQGRWNMMTVIIAAHTDKALDNELKKNCYNTIYSDEGIARTVFQRDSTALDKQGKNEAMAAVRETFTADRPHQKLWWCRPERKYYKVTATPRTDIRFGSELVWKYCDLIRTERGVNTGNKFMKCFT